MTSFPRILDAWYLTGPTGASKSAVGLQLAELLGAEIVSMDSMAVYRGMNIGTAKPEPADLQTLRHHLIDVVDPTDEYSVTEYLAAVHRCVEEIRARDRNVLFVGGTPLYLKALLQGLCSGPEANWQMREELAKEAETLGPEALHRRLAAIDPRSAERVHPHDTKRLIRALEVFELTGEPISELQVHFKKEPEGLPVHVFVLDWPREILHERIDVRVNQMYELGLVDEVRQLIRRYGSLSRTADQAIGYREAIAHSNGKIDLETAIRETKTRTRRLARRQMTWFRRLAQCRWIAMASTRSPRQVAQELAAGSAD